MSASMLFTYNILLYPILEEADIFVNTLVGEILKKIKNQT